jgi:hypothetical protein
VVDEAGSALGDGANRVGAVEGGGGQEGETRRDGTPRRRRADLLLLLRSAAADHIHITWSTGAAGRASCKGQYSTKRTKPSAWTRPRLYWSYMYRVLYTV